MNEIHVKYDDDIICKYAKESILLTLDYLYDEFAGLESGETHIVCPWGMESGLDVAYGFMMLELFLKYVKQRLEQ